MEKIIFQKTIEKKEDLLLTKEEKEFIKGFSVELYGDRIALMMLDVKPTKSSLIIPEYGSRNINPDKRTSPSERDPSMYPVDKNLAVVVGVGKNSSKQMLSKPGDLVYIDSQRPGATAIMYDEKIFMIISENQIVGRLGNLL